MKKASVILRKKIRSVKVGSLILGGGQPIRIQSMTKVPTRNVQATLEQIDRLVEDRTVIMIAHRLGSVQRCDEIMIVEQGRIVEQGDRKQLAEAPESRFHRLLQIGLDEALA